MAYSSAGEIWRSYFQLGKQASIGAAVAATRRAYFSPSDSKFSNEREVRFHKFATGTRENVRQATSGPSTPGGTVKMPLSATELLEILLMGVEGDISPSGAGVAKLWEFTPAGVLDPATVEWYDGARAWELIGSLVDRVKISGSVKEANMVEADIFGLELAASAMTAALPERTPDFIEGWETRIFADDFGDPFGTTQLTGVLLNWEIEYKNNLVRRYFADNTLEAGAIRLGEVEITAKLTFDAASAHAIAEFNNWNGVTKRNVRVRFGDNEVIDGADKLFADVDLAGAWSAVDIGGVDDNSRTYDLSMSYVYDPTNAFGVRYRLQNARATSF